MGLRCPWVLRSSPGDSGLKWGLRTSRGERAQASKLDRRGSNPGSPWTGCMTCGDLLKDAGLRFLSYLKEDEGGLNGLLLKIK